MKDVPEALNRIVDKVLAYRPKPKTKAARKRSVSSEEREGQEAHLNGGFPI
jgi:hypothetical protein